MAVNLTTGYPLAAGDEKAQITNLQQVLTSLIDELRHILYNLDDGNFNQKLVLEKNGMKAEIAASAAEISAKISQTDLDGALSAYSTAQQTAEAIRTAVVRGVKLSEAIQTVLAPDDSAAFDKSKYYMYQGEVYYYNTVSGKWEIADGDNIYTLFEQTAEGFRLKGNTVIDGKLTVTRDLTLSGNVTWDMENSPVQTQYSADGVSFHTLQTTGDMYLRMSFDGGRNWSNPTKVVGSDGKNGRDGADGTDGSDANVTPQNVFNALTDNGAQQGIFAAFIDKENKLYINTEYLSTKIAEVADTLYIGDYDTGTEQKHIYFNNQANIHTYETGVGQNGLAISANGLQIWLKPSEIKLTSPDSGSFSSGSVTLAEYVASYAGGGASSRLYAEDYPSGYYVKLQLSDGDFGLFSPSAGASANAASTSCVWGILHSSPGADEESVNYFAFGTNYLGFNNTQQKTYPKGSWDFQGWLYYKGKLVATREWVEGKIAEAGGGGGTTTAVFG